MPTFELGDSIPSETAHVCSHAHAHTITTPTMPHADDPNLLYLGRERLTPNLECQCRL